MASSTAMNDQVTDAVTQPNVNVVGEAPDVSLGAIYQAQGHSTGILFENGVAVQQQQNMLSMAAANPGVLQFYSLDTTAGTAGTEKMGLLGTPDQMTTMMTIYKLFK